MPETIQSIIRLFADDTITPKDFSNAYTFVFVFS